MDHASVERFRVAALARPQGGIQIGIPFDPQGVWGELDAYHVNGTIGGQPFRGALTPGDDRWWLQLGPSWSRRPGFEPGDEVDVVMAPEGPRTFSMGADVEAAFAVEPQAARFFDSMPTFYRNNVARSIEGAKRPDTRARRISEAVDMARQGRRER